MPLTFALTMKACLSQKHTERPSFAQILQLLADLQKEVSKGSYVDSTGRVQVMPPSPPPAVLPTHPCTSPRQAGIPSVYPTV